MKTLIVVAHPSMEASVVNKRWLKELKTQPEKYTVHDLYKAYPDWKIDVEKEQKLIEAHDSLILQFPIQWFSCPALLKQWLDDVFTYGWAYGSKGSHLKNRKVALAVSAGIRQSDYSEQGRYQYTLEQLLIPFETTFSYCQADYRSVYAFYGNEHAPGATEEEEWELDRDILSRSANEYIAFIQGIEK
ncbi:NAD(P)H-dependent oxidoreductase [Alkalihalobacillus oceani]|uniref:NAD(P)H-dependent oxidoreductase n=1 Tax=Halalkalibacter oceani TaxID=1653776 RepID=UPI0020405B4B|nr:NAD(P)H-dependent oxidoreductase [Halalkalibacter oceani]MCM3760884.1 NAD(P)H-dependent oxidoreductase [Halalkalibacter oceani]